MNIMGGTVIETEADKIKLKLIIGLGQEDGLDNEANKKITTKNCWFAFEQSGGLFGRVWKAVCIGEETTWNRIKSGDILYCEKAIKDIKSGGKYFCKIEILPFRVEIFG